jgi:putative tryptophan/tyrosine transport system substrate-binding protein
MACCTQIVHAVTPEAIPAHILVLQSASGGPYEKFTETFIQTLKNVEPKTISRVAVLTSETDVSSQLAALSASDLLVTVGTHATETALRSKTTAPLLSVMVPRLTAQQLMKATGNPPHQISTIYLDQPMSRYFALIRLVLPHAGKIGLVLGPATKTEIEKITATARQSRVIPLISVVPVDSDNPLPSLEKLLHNSDAILALPDPLVYNRYTLPPLLLTTFRYRVPMIGFSAAIVNAGAVAGVYSNPEQIGQQAAEMVIHHELPAHGEYPRYFQVSFNQAVAHALDIPLPDRERVESLLQKQTGIP